jgi:hypothetical protein
LECVTEARKDKDGLKQLTEWCLITKYNARDIILDLNQIWCTNRKHWWCLLTFPGSSPPALEPFPNLPALVTVGDVLPDFPIWPPDHQHQLDIGLYEYRKFYVAKPFTRTQSAATHSFASMACHELRQGRGLGQLRKQQMKLQIVGGEGEGGG